MKIAFSAGFAQATVEAACTGAARVALLLLHVGAVLCDTWYDLIGL